MVCGCGKVVGVVGRCVCGKIMVAAMWWVGGCVVRLWVW